MDSAWWTLGTGVFVAIGGFASFGAAAAGAATLTAAGGASATATVLGLTLGPVGWTFLALALLGAAVYCSWQAWATDDANLLPVEYWLDNGSFGKQKFVSGEAAAGNPFAKAGKVEPFVKLDHEIEALQRVLFVAQGRMWTAKDSGGYSIMCHYEVALPRYEAGSRLEVVFIANDEGRRFEVGRIVCEDGKAQPSHAHIEPRLTGLREGPKLQLDAKAGTLKINGLFATMQDPTIVNKAAAWLGHQDTNVYADQFEMRVKYWPDRTNLPQLTSEVKAQG
jgi:hypothetical protein